MVHRVTSSGKRTEVHLDRSHEIVAIRNDEGKITMILRELNGLGTTDRFYRLTLSDTKLGGSVRLVKIIPTKIAAAQKEEWDSVAPEWRDYKALTSVSKAKAELEAERARREELEKELERLRKLATSKS